MAAVLLVCVAVPLGAFAWIATRRNAEGGRRWPGVWRAFLAGALLLYVFYFEIPRGERKLEKEKLFANLSRDRIESIAIQNKSGSFTLVNSEPVKQAADSQDKETGAEIVCGKTGYVVQSGNCAASYGEDQNGNGYICVTADSTSAWRCIYDHVALYSEFTA